MRATTIPIDRWSTSPSWCLQVFSPAAGFKTDMQVVDWATLIQRRNDPALWDIYITHSAVLPEPMLSPPQLGDGAPGWWSSPAKEAALAAFNAEPDPAKRGALWGKVQQVVYTKCPTSSVGNFNSLSARSPKLRGLRRRCRGRSSGTPACRSEARSTCSRPLSGARSQRHDAVISRRASPAWLVVMCSWPRWCSSSPALAPGDPARSCWATRRPPRTSRSCATSYGLDKPLPVQFVLLAEASWRTATSASRSSCSGR